MTTKNTAESPREIPTAERANLDRQYRKIGISAVAAALRYQGGAKNPAYAPAVASRQDDERLVAAA